MLISRFEMELTIFDHVICLGQFIVLSKYDNYKILKGIYDFI